MQQVNFPFQLNVFIKSIISHPFLKHFKEMIVSTKYYHPVTWSDAVTVVGQVWGVHGGRGRGEEGNLPMIPRNFISSAQFQRK